MKAKAKPKSLPFIAFEHKRDAYGFAVRPQHLQRYKEYTNIYKEEEEERSDRWKKFLEWQQQAENEVERPKESTRATSEVSPSSADKPHGESEDVHGTILLKKHEEDERSETHLWNQIRSSLSPIEQMMRFRVKKKKSSVASDLDAHKGGAHTNSVDEARSPEDSDDEFYDVEKVEPNQDAPSVDSSNANIDVDQHVFGPWKDELECLVHGGLPVDLRGELWQAFVGAGARRVKGHYESLLADRLDNKESKTFDALHGEGENGKPEEKLMRQIEKDLPRTFPGHPGLGEDGRIALRRLLIAYARHNPSVGYCQGMSFFAGLLLLLMPEENAFWTFTGIIDDYFDGYFSEEMIECQVDQLVLEELISERFPKLVNHLDYLGVQVAWVTGHWFLSIFVNILPWESVLRVWDVLLFDGNRVMLFRTALALMELYGPALVTTKDAGDAVTLLQSLVGSTFDSSQLVLTACMGFQFVNEMRLQEMRDQHRPSVIAAMEDRARGLRIWKDWKGLASKMYSLQRDVEPLVSLENTADSLSDAMDGNVSYEVDSTNIDDVSSSLSVDSELSSLPDLKEQVMWLKVEMCRLLEEKRSAVSRADELETALMEMVTQDNRRQLSAKVEQLEQEVSELRQALSDKQEEEHAMLQVLVRVEQELKVAEDCRICAEQDATAQRYAANVIEKKYDEAMSLLSQMENRAILAETMLEATLQSQASHDRAQSSSPSPRSPSLASQDISQDFQTKRTGLLGLVWRDKNKGNTHSADESPVLKPVIDSNPVVETHSNDLTGQQEHLEQ